MSQNSSDNVILSDLRYYVRHAKRLLNKDMYQNCLSMLVGKRNYDQTYVSLNMERVTDPVVLDFAQEVLTRLANLERMR